MQRFQVLKLCSIQGQFVVVSKQVTYHGLLCNLGSIVPRNCFFFMQEENVLVVHMVRVHLPI